MNGTTASTTRRAIGLALHLISYCFLPLSTEAFASDSAAGVKGTLWITNRGTHEVAALDPSTGRVIGTIPLAPNATPIGVTAPCGLGKIYVSAEGTNQMLVISKSSLTVEKQIAIGARPHHISHSPDGRFVYAAEFGTNKVAVIETTTDTLVAEYETGAATARTHAVWATRDGTTLYVANSVANEIAALDAPTGRILWNLAVGNNPSEVLVTRDGKTAYVSVRNENKVKIVDLRSRQITDELVVGVQPDTLSLTANEKTLLIGLRGTPAKAAIVDLTTTPPSVKTVDIPGATTTGHNWLSENSRYLFIATEGPTFGVAVIDVAKASVVATFPYGAGGKPHGVFYEPRAWHAVARFAFAGCR